MEWLAAPVALLPCMSFFHSSPVPASVATSSCRAVFGLAQSAIRQRQGESVLGLSLPVLGGPESELLLEGTEAPTVRDGCTLFEGPGALAGFVVAPAEADLETASRDIYRRIFTVAQGRHLHRIWNYVPQINAVEANLENYRRFCRGRSLAFESEFGRGFQRRLPAASAVGATGGPLAVAFLIGDAAPRHFENPRQIPAFEYPSVYGPRPPSFSRATLVEAGSRRTLFVSGTASIRGHLTIAVGDLAGQLACTRENLQIIATTAGAGADFGAAEGWQRTFKVYLRHDTDLLQVKNDLERHFLRADDTVTYLQADLCRADLLVEIEAVLTKG